MKVKIIMVLAIATILFGLYGLVNNLSMPNPINIQPTKEVKIKVWRLKKDVELSEEIDRRMLSIESISEEKANSLGFFEDVAIELKPGTVFRNTLNKGDYLSMNDLIAPNDDGYIDYVIAPERVPFPLTVDPSSITGGVIRSGTIVDILALASTKNMSKTNRNVKKSVSITPIFSGVKVLKVKRTVKKERNDVETETVNLILELTREQATKLIVAKEIASIEVYKSIGKYDSSDLQADAGDILKDFNSITEYRANKVVIK
ncbi:Flp pilus assembly protein CpaB [Aliivibrio sifiae]|uniref:Flp pilus assembly protein CpaB n=1 Tax=Aliivibrio sifiae TaxID=566293 RepID=UPI003D0A775E